jgi:glycosyltransferase involved in cell wall biosynthesis
VYNGLDLERFPFAPPEKRTPLIVSVGRLVEKKGFEDLIDACAFLAARNISFRCMIVGEGELEAKLCARISALNLNSQVQLVGPRPQSEVIALVQQAAVFAAPCVVGGDGNRDGLPTVLLEAMALGTPCIATDVTGIPEIIRDDETGLIVPQHDPSGLSEAIEDLLRDESRRVRLAVNARRLIEKQFDVHRNAEEMRSLFMHSGESEVDARQFVEAAQ